MPLNPVGEQLDPDNLPEGVSMPGLGKYGPGIEDVTDEDGTTPYVKES
jgi:hypothetical protein